MGTTFYDPYAAVMHAEWRERARRWRARPGESVFHLAGLLALLGAGVAMALRAGPPLLDSAAALWARYPEAAALAFLGAAASSGWQASRRAIQIWTTDWLAAQPTQPAVHRRRLRGIWLRQGLAWALPGAAVLAWADAETGPRIALPVGLLLAAGVGGRWAQRPPRAASQRTRRVTPFASRGRGTMSTWQLAEAGATLAPARLAPLLLVLLLMPRGPWTMILPALLLVIGLSLAHAWQRSVAVIPRAEAWLQTQPVRAGRWLRDAAALPTLLGAALAGLTAAVIWKLSGGYFAALTGIGVLALLALIWAVTVRWRRTPRHIGMHVAAQGMLLALVAQSLPIAAPALWAIQMVWLVRKGWR
ncbi:MAG: hypothetical protein KDJ14_01615 [Xanthomonadales bacterium]|nr:hypothetical protein [Xanthomonadales bacterium]